GAGAGLILATGQVVLADISTPARRARTISIYQGTFLFAVGIGPFPGGLIAERLGLAAPFVAYGSASLLAAMVAWFAVRETRPLFSQPGALGPPAGGEPTAQPFSSQIRLLVGKSGLLLVGLIALLNAVVRTGGLFAIIPILGTVQLGLSVGAIGTAMMLGSLFGLASAYPAGTLAEPFGCNTGVLDDTGVTAPS